MAHNIPPILYIASGVLFILALRGLSSPETARQGNRFGVIGMGLAVLTTLFLLENQGLGTWFYIILAAALGGGAGAAIAQRVQMTQMPQLVAAFHSLVGLAAVAIAWAAFLAPTAFGVGSPGDIHASSMFEMSLGAAIGAITFSGSVIAGLKLNGNMSGKPIILPARHFINLLLAAVLVVFILVLMSGKQTSAFFLGVTIIAFALGFLIIIPIGGADMPVVVSMLNSYSGWAAAGIGFTLENMALIITGALVGSSGAILS